MTDRIVPLNRGFAIIDEEDYHLVEPYRWYYLEVMKNPAKPKAYAIGRLKGAKIKKGTTVYMHRIVMDAKKGKRIDHRDGDGLNNRKANLREASGQQNAWNRGSVRPNKSSIYKGVTKQSAKTWTASIMAHGKKTNLGSFHVEIEAALAYDAAALLQHGEFAMTNEKLGLVPPGASLRLAPMEIAGMLLAAE